jgi:hypothetical protein
VTRTATRYRYEPLPKSRHRHKCRTGTASEPLHHRTVPHHYRNNIGHFPNITATKSSDYRYMLSKKI